MKFEKKGLIYCPENPGNWNEHTFMTPTPFLIKEDIIRIFGGFRDKAGISRIGFIDVDARNPQNIINISKNPVLDIGIDGMFDDNGIILGSIINNNDQIWMYYVGFQLVKKVKFLAYSGLAISINGGDNFIRIQNTPVLDRYKNEVYIRAIHSVIKENNKFKIWYSTGNRWQYINGIAYPQYKIMYTESEDGINIPLEEGIDCIDVIGDEYRIGRPIVFFEEGIYKMYYTRDTLAKKYKAGYAESKDGINWVRLDNKFTLETSKIGWDSEMICYPFPINTKYGKYVFYSGNNMGATGVGYAKIIEK